MSCFTRNIDTKSHEALKIVGCILKWLRFGYGDLMQIEIDEHLCAKVQTLTTLNLKEPEYAYFVEFLAEVGFSTVKAALLKYPHLTFGDLVMIRYRDVH